MAVESPLGPMKGRLKTDVRLSHELSQEIDALCEFLGVSRNTFMVLAAARLVVDLGRLHKVRKRRTMIKKMRDLFNEVVDEVEKAA